MKRVTVEERCVCVILPCFISYRENGYDAHYILCRKYGTEVIMQNKENNNQQNNNQQNNNQQNNNQKNNNQKNNNQKNNNQQNNCDN